MIVGFITGKQLLRYGFIIVNEFGITTYLKCLYYVVSNKKKTFLDIACCCEGDKEKVIRSAGFVLVKEIDNETKYLILRAYNFFDFPKGRQDEGETLLETAYRETLEEAGISKADIIPIDEVGYTTEPYAKPKKTATYFLGRSSTDKVILLPNPVSQRIEHHGYCWVNYEEAKQLLNPRLNKVLDWANEKIRGAKNAKNESSG